MDSIKTGNLIKEQRKLKGMTQKELGQKLNVTDRAVSKWERGLNAPDISLLIPLSRLLEISVTELINGQLSGNSGSEDIDTRLKTIIDYSEKEIEYKTNTFKKNVVRFIRLFFITAALVVPVLNGLVFGDGFVYRCIPAHICAEKAAMAIENYDRQGMTDYINDSVNMYEQLCRLKDEDVIILQADTKLCDTKLEDMFLVLEMDFIVRHNDIKYRFTCNGTYRNGKIELMNIVTDDLYKDYPQWMLKLSDALSTYNPG